jgi:hypothetical protein
MRWCARRLTRLIPSLAGVASLAAILAAMKAVEDLDKLATVAKLTDRLYSARVGLGVVWIAARRRTEDLIEGGDGRA